MKIIPSSRRYGHVAKAGMCLIALLLIAGMSGCYDEYPQLPPCGSQNLEIWTWYDLDAVRDNRCGNHTLMNDLDSTTPGYEELAGPTASGGKGWDPVAINGTFNGQGYEIRGLFINRPDEGSVGLFSWACRTAVIKNVGVVNATVTGEIIVGGLLGKNDGTLNNCYALGNISGGGWGVGGLVGFNDESFDYSGVVCECYSAGMVSGHMFIGGLVGENSGTVSASYASGNTTGSAGVGGLVGWNYGTVSASYASGNTTGSHGVAGLVGWNGQGIVSDSYSIGSVSGNSSVGGLVGENDGNVRDSFWDTETSGQATSDGGTGRTTAEMQNVVTFSGVGWDIIAVGSPGTRRTSYIWNIVDAVTYPFLSWQP